ncbi:NRDE family protein [Ferrimonas balearica]|uniref:NRDE family protein n=1 Tax=Ferrimonas balearica TaxID=44012 RepID=UPI001C939B0B|nr:NRDE family protein [Ferrimonas balearica]MBY5980353.1 NRDE family protein [Ferrimonas balearica]
MCLIALDWRPGTAQPLVLWANRDEFFARPTEPLQRWNNGLWAGRDVQAGGTWLGLSERGALAALTNVREPGQPPGPRSRGALITDFLLSDADPMAFFEHWQGEQYSGVNLLLVRGNRLVYGSNRGAGQGAGPTLLAPGRYGLSNAALDTPWPKLERLKAMLEPELAPDAALARLRDTHRPDDHQLPDTGIGLEWERLLSPIFIRSPHYGTRSSSVLRVQSDGQFDWLEQGYSPDGPLGLAQVSGQLRQPIGQDPAVTRGSAAAG